MLILALVLGSEGYRELPGALVSRRYLTMAADSHRVKSPSSRTGTFPLGFLLRWASDFCSWEVRSMSTGSKSIPACLQTYMANLLGADIPKA